MSLMEKRIETITDTPPLFHAQSFEWMSLMEKRIETEAALGGTPRARNTEWMSLMEKRIETFRLAASCLYGDFTNEWALWKKGLRLRLIGVFFRLWVRMNEPYGKKDWDSVSGSAIFIAVLSEWMSLMEKRIETIRFISVFFRLTM